MNKTTMYYLVCKTCKELIDENTSLLKLRNLKKGLIQGKDTAHTQHEMHIIDENGVKIPDEQNISE